MITTIRDVRKARGLTLDQVARACVPPTTAQQIGRLEVGTRAVSVAWLNRIAADLVTLPDRADLPVAAILDSRGVRAPTRPLSIVPPAVAPGQVAIRVAEGIGDYRAGDVLWCATLALESFARAMNRDVLVPRAAGHFAFGHLLDHDGTRLHLLPPGPGLRQQVVAAPPWLALATRLVRDL